MQNTTLPTPALIWFYATYHEAITVKTLNAIQCGITGTLMLEETKFFKVKHLTFSSCTTNICNYSSIAMCSDS